MTHAWCSDPARDSAVRAAEDGRTGPLPTLGEAIALAFGFDKASAQRACDEVKSWPDDVQKDCRFVLGDLLEQGVERLQALVEACRYGKGLMGARYPAMIPKSVSASSAPEQENKGVRMTKSDRQAADYRAEAIARPFADAAERSVPVSKTGEGQSGMRTERVTLEITHDGKHGPVSTWPFECGSHGKGVRVVEEACPDAWAQTFARLEAERDAAIRERDNERLVRIGTETDRDFARREKDAAIRHIIELRTERDKLKARVAELEAASGGNQPETPVSSTHAASDGGGWEVVAYFVKWNERDWGVQDQTFRTLQRAQDYIKDEKSEDEKPQIVPLYAVPPQPRGWLTEQEIDAVADAADTLSLRGCGSERRARILRELLARSSPPEVVLESWREAAGEVVSLDDVRAALAAAGVAVKEVS